MTQPLFKIGSVYRQRNGDVVRLDSPCQTDADGRAIAWARHPVSSGGKGHRLMETGAEWDTSMTHHSRDLIPGELQRVNGAWVPITEQPMSVYFAEPVEDEPAKPLGGSITAADKFYDRIAERLGLPTLASAAAWLEHGRKAVGVPRTVWDGVVVYGIEATVESKPASKTPTLDKLEAECDPNAAMIRRDGPAAPKPAVVALPAAPTAHPAINGLTFLGAVDHRLGARVVHGD